MIILYKKFFYCTVQGLDSSNIMSITVLEELVCVMTESEEYIEGVTVTLGHFLHHLHRPLEQTVRTMAHNIVTADLLLSQNPKK